MKRDLTGWEKSCANHVSDKRLICKVSKEFTELNNNNKTHLVKNGQESKIDIFPKRASK